MSDILLHCLDVVAVLQGDHCVCMSQIMKTGIGNADRSDDFLEILVYGGCA